MGRRGFEPTLDPAHHERRLRVVLGAGGMETDDVAGRRLEVAARRGAGRYLLPRAGHEPRAVPAPDARLLSTARAAAWVACSVNRHRLSNVRASGSEDCGLVALHDVLPCAPSPPEDRPVDHPRVSRPSERYDHGLALRAGEGPAKDFQNRISYLGVV